MYVYIADDTIAGIGTPGVARLGKIPPSRCNTFGLIVIGIIANVIIAHLHCRFILEM